MTPRWPGAVSSLRKFHHAGVRVTVIPRRALGGTLLRRYSTTPPPSKQDAASDKNRHEKIALFEITGVRKQDPLNPPRSTLPPPLKLPERGTQNVALYYFHIGRAYGGFYWVGIKAVWFNYQASKALRERVTKEVQAESQKSVERSTWLRHLSRSEFQLLERNNYDIGKLPFFGLLVCVFGEWLPLLVPFIPNVVPGTCRIPKQIRGMRAKAEERRRVSFRHGISEPAHDQIPSTDAPPQPSTQEHWPMVRQEHARTVLERLRDDQLHHLSSTLNNHNRLWDRVQLAPPSSLLRRGLSRRLAYLASDDRLLHAGGGAQGLSADELAIACAERGMDVLGKQDDTLRHNLSWWLARQEEDRGRGHALLTMLFRRPNAWKTVVSDKR